MIVVVPSYNDRPFLERLFESLYTNEPGHPFRMIVVSDFSNDGTAEWLASLPINVIQPKGKAYFTRACNAGLQWGMMNSESEWFFLLNSDMIVTPHWCSNLIVTGMALKAGIVGATLLNMDGTVQHLGAFGVGYHFGIDKPWVRYQKDRLVPWVTGGAMAIHRSVIERIGFLPTKEPASQYDESDRDFCTVAQMTYGINTAVSTGCIIYHDTHQARNIRLARGDYSL